MSRRGTGARRRSRHAGRSSVSVGLCCRSPHAGHTASLWRPAVDSPAERLSLRRRWLEARRSRSAARWSASPGSGPAGGAERGQDRAVRELLAALGLVLADDLLQGRDRAPRRPWASRVARRMRRSAARGLSEALRSSWGPAAKDTPGRPLRSVGAAIAYDCCARGPIPLRALSSDGRPGTPAPAGRDDQKTSTTTCLRQKRSSGSLSSGQPIVSQPRLSAARRANGGTGGPGAGGPPTR